MGAAAGDHTCRVTATLSRFPAAGWARFFAAALAPALLLALFIAGDSVLLPPETRWEPSRAGARPPGHCSSVPAPGHECRFWATIGIAGADSLMEEHLVSGSHSLMSLGDSNPNGWGLAYFSPALQNAGWQGPALVRGGPAANHEHDPRFPAAVAQMLALDPTCAIAHVRRSSGAHTGVPDPHPLWRDGVALAHNGRFTVTDVVNLLEFEDPGYLESHPPDYSDPYLDSELMLLYILKLREAGAGRGDARAAQPAAHGRPGSHALADAVNQAILRIYDAGAIINAADCVVTDGDTLIGVRFDVEDEELFKLRYRALSSGWVIASEPLGTDTTGWEAFPPKSLGVFTPAGPPEFVTIFPPSAPYLVVDSLGIDDDALGDSRGNGDGDVDAGETIELIITLLNQGYEAALNTRATLTTEDPLCEILDAEELYGDIPAGGTAPCQEDFDLVIDPTCPDGYLVPLTLTVGCEGPFVWERAFDLGIHASAIDVEHYLIDDLGTGNGNGRVEPGETFRISTTLVNRGTEQAAHLLLSLEIPHPYVSVTQGQAALDTLSIGGLGTPAPPFEASLGPGAPAQDVLFGRLEIRGDWGLQAEADFLVPVGGFHDDVESGQGGWTSYPIDPEFDNQWHRSSGRNYTPGGAWSWKFGGAGTGNYANSAAGALESEPVPLRAYTYLRVRHWMEAEASQTYPGYCYDGGFVELLAEGGAWQQIFPVGGYPLKIRNASGEGPFPANTEVYSGNIEWEEALFEIRGHSGEGRFRFVFGSDGGTTREGWYIDEVECFGADTLWWSAVDEAKPLILHPALGPSRPNPGPPGLRIQFDVPGQGPVDLEIFDIAGRRVRTLVADTLPAGRHDIRWDGRDAGGRPVNAGTYFYRLRCGGACATHRLVLVR